jgi:alkylation response protein AidB-like acyl-CoA dehydrogenase
VAAPKIPELDAKTILAAARGLEPLLRANAEAIEAERRMPEPVLRALIDAGVFRIAMPQSWGGPELDPITQIEVIEAVTRGDASAGWITTILSDTGFYSGWLDDGVAREMFELDHRTAGQVFPAGRADRVPGGWRVSGHWAFGSGCLHADWLVGGAILHEAGEPVPGAMRLPRWRVFFFRPEDCEIIDTWHTTGLAGTSSNDYEVRDVFVPEEQTFDVAARARREGPLYRYHGLFFANLPGVPLGLARNAIDELVRIAGAKRVVPTGNLMRQEYRVQEAVGEAEAVLGSARAYVYDVMGDLWRTLCAGDPLSLQQRSRVGLMLVHSVRAGLQVVQLMADTAGSPSIYRSNLLERYRRDMLTASAHVVGQRRAYAAVGHVLLGGDANFAYF